MSRFVIPRWTRILVERGISKEITDARSNIFYYIGHLLKNKLASTH